MGKLQAADEAKPGLKARWRRWSLGEKFLLGTCVCLGVAMVGFLGVSLYSYYNDPVFNDEWHCEKGQAPVVTDLGSSACWDEGEELPPGFHWDPLGNRPFECSWRYGWEPIHRVDTGEGDCVRATDPPRLLPSGWAYDNFEIRS